MSSEQNLLQMCKKMNSKTAKYIGTSMDIKNHRIAQRVKSSDFFLLDVKVAVGLTNKLVCFNKN